MPEVYPLVVDEMLQRLMLCVDLREPFTWRMDDYR